jgi:hypothetical protein
MLQLLLFKKRGLPHAHMLLKLRNHSGSLFEFLRKNHSGSLLDFLEKILKESCLIFLRKNHSGIQHDFFGQNHSINLFFNSIF